MTTNTDAVGSKKPIYSLGAALTATLLLSCSSVAVHAASNDDLAAEIRELKAQIREMKSAISATRVETRRTEARVRAVAVRTPAPAYNLPPPAMAIPAGAVPAFVTADKRIQFGAITITPGGFIEGGSVFRSKTFNSDIATQFNNLPFPNNPLGHADEYRFSARQTRVALLAEAAITPTFLASGYLELDFTGAAPTANQNQTNSYTPRIRHLYTTLDNEDYGMHVLAGQNWSLLTLNSKGITPRNEVTPTVIDSSQTIGSIYARQPQIRLTKDFGKKLWLSISAESSETTEACNTANPAFTQALNPNNGANGGLVNNLNVQNITCGAFGAGSNAGTTAYSLNHIPDFVGKAAYEARVFDRDVHLEGFGVLTDLYDRVQYGNYFTNGRGFITQSPTFSNKDTQGYGFGGGLIVPVIPKRVDFQINALYGKGINRYGPGQLPEATFSSNGALRPLQGLIALTGVTVHATPSIDVYAYAGVETQERYYVQNNSADGVTPGTFVGVGGPNTNDTFCKRENAFTVSSTGAIGTNCGGATKAIFELTGGFWDKIYKGSFGEVRGGIQYAFLHREIFNTPGNLTTTPPVAGMYGPTTTAHMVFTSLRYYPFQ